jgi:hypothetical protein
MPDEPTAEALTADDLWPVLLRLAYDIIGSSDAGQRFTAQERLKEAVKVAIDAACRRGIEEAAKWHDGWVVAYAANGNTQKAEDHRWCAERVRALAPPQEGS